MSDESSKLKNLTFELDSLLGSIGDRISTLVDADELLGQLVMDMNNAAYRKQEMMCYADHHRRIRALSELIRYSLADLSKEYEKTDEIKKQLFNEVVDYENH